ncbi:hypothetical protein MIR68_008433 [Amoeboaphelidium protococcarum]|nr:hypothetical protein MIR68_008433 [Amoeboaphelidium protococcarum]
MNVYIFAFVAQAIMNPLLWNIAARSEYRTHWLSKCVGDKYRGCYILAFCIFVAGIWRDYLYKLALESMHSDRYLMQFEHVPLIGAVLIAIGNVFVLSSMYQLGITGTYLGDYFGILMSHRVTAFPFNVMNNPMYNGSTLVFLGTALWYQKVTGIWLSVFVFFLYKVALSYEEPFTAMIYAQRDGGKSNKSYSNGTRQSPLQNKKTK